MRSQWIAALGAIVLGLAGCITKEAVLTNNQGQTQTCKKTGRIGIVSGYVLDKRFHNCVDKAKADGYKEAAQKTSSSAD